MKVRRKSGSALAEWSSNSKANQRIIVANSTRGHLPRVVMGNDWSVPWADASSQLSPSLFRALKQRYGTIISPSSPIGDIRETGDKESDRHNQARLQSVDLHVVPVS